MLTRCSFILSLCVPKSIDYKTSMVSSEDRNVPFLAFEPLSYVPIQVDCCNIEDLTAEERQWLIDYNSKCVELLTPKISDELVLNWLKDQMETTKKLLA